MVCSGNDDSILRNALLFHLVAFFILGFASPFFAQSNDYRIDSTLSMTSGFEQLSAGTKDLIERERVKNQSDFRIHQIVFRQGRSFVKLKNELENASTFLRQGLSYRGIKEQINQLEYWKMLAGEGVITGSDNFQTVRNLTATSILLREILNRTSDRLVQITSFHKTLAQFQFRIDSMLMDSILYMVPADSISLVRYFQRLVLINQDYKQVKGPMKIALDSVEKLEIQVSMIKFGLESDIAETESQMQAMHNRIGFFESGTFGSGIDHQMTTSQVIYLSVEKALLVMWFYLLNHLSSMILIVLFIIGLAGYFTILARKIIDGIPGEKHEAYQQIIRHPVASAILLVITVFQFFLPIPPFVFSGLLWLISGIALAVIMRRSVPDLLYAAWLVICGLVFLGFLSNLLLWQAAFERWTMLVFMLVSLAFGMLLLIRIKTRYKKRKLIMVFIGLMVAFEILALINYLAGGYNQSKTFMVTGVFGVALAYLMLWSVRLGKSALKLSLRFFKGLEDDSADSPGEERTEEKCSVFFCLVFAVGWLVLISRNFYFYQTIIDPLRQELQATRSIGAFSFTYESILIFLGILILSGFISRIVSLLTFDQATETGKQKSGGLGSWMVLIRIAIITLGVLLAFISAGIPMDRVAIILGALSVGVGFGLQTLINNLVSGVIIAFEKPINVGDIVEINTQVGRMKSIGIRSSVVSTWDGADVIIPNGDLLNQHLINWTLGSARRRFEIPIGVAYGTDLQKTMTRLLDLMNNDPRILKYPEPVVLASEFGSSSVNLVLKFWVGHFSIGFDVKSDLIVGIERLFNEEGIEIPFPQQDVYIRTKK